MNFEEFKNEVKDRIRDYLPKMYKDAEVTIQPVVKNNDQKLDGLMIRLDDSKVVPNIYLNDFYKQEESGRDMVDILHNIADIRMEHNKMKDFDISSITDFDQVKDKIECRLINGENNMDYLKDKPFTKVEDLAVMYAINLGEGAGGKMSVPITDQLFEKFGIEKDELHEIAINNLENQRPSFMGMREAMIQMMYPEGLPDSPGMLDELFPKEMDSNPMYILSNESRMNGANMALNTKMMDEIAEKLNGDFIVLPSSVHELLILPQSNEMNKKDLEMMVREVNACEVAPGERLSDHVYGYDSVEHELVLADTLLERQQEREEKGASRSEITGKGDLSEKGRGDKEERVSMKEMIPEKTKEANKLNMDRPQVDIGKKHENSLA